MFFAPSDFHVLFPGPLSSLDLGRDGSRHRWRRFDRTRQDDEEIGGANAQNPEIAAFLNQARIALLKNQGDGWAQVNQTFSTRFGLNVTPRDLLEALLSARLERLKSEFVLTAEQVTKLRLAGHADVTRFEDRLHVIADRFEQEGITGNARQGAMVELQDALKSVETGFFVGDALFLKVLALVLGQEPAVKSLTSPHAAIPIQTGKKPSVKECVRAGARRTLGSVSSADALHLQERF